MQKGTVKFFNEEKGFGFISKEGAGKDDKDIFVHVTGLVDQVQKDDLVTFNIDDSPKGPIAINVQRA